MWNIVNSTIIAEVWIIRKAGEIRIGKGKGRDKKEQKLKQKQ